MTITLRSVYSLSTTAPSRVMSDEPTLVCQKVGIQEKAGIKYPTMATNLQPTELRTEIRRATLGNYNYLCTRNERSLVAFA